MHKLLIADTHKTNFGPWNDDIFGKAHFLNFCFVGSTQKKTVFWNLVRVVSCKSGNTAACVGGEDAYRLVLAKSAAERQLTWKTEKEMEW